VRPETSIRDINDGDKGESEVILSDMLKERIKIKIIVR
jgi:hypothetical protein